MPVGFAIGAAGVVAAFMAIRAEDWKKAEKAFWIVIITVLWVLDVHNINREQQAHFKEQKALSDSLSDTQVKVSTAIDQLKAVAEMQQKTNDVATENLNQITGGDSYVYFDCTQVMGPAEIAINGLPKGAMLSNCIYHFVGKYPLQFHVSVEGPLGRWEVEYGKMQPRELGRGREALGLIFFPDNPYHFNITINASNGIYFQNVIFRKVGDKWGWASRLYKYGGAKQRLMKEFHSPEFPEKLMDADWDKI
jgi:hypothetical protein